MPHAARALVVAQMNLMKIHREAFRPKGHAWKV
jgi:hypothetical protein